jgi:hypothetical protein
MGASITRAMRSFAAWVSRRPWRLVLLTVGFARVLATVSSALLVLDALRRGPAAAAVSTMASILGVAVLGALIGSNMMETLGLSALFLLGGAASGALLWWSRSLSLAYQGTAVGFILLTLAVFVLVPEAGRIGEVLQNEFLVLLQVGGADEAQLAQFAQVDPAEFVRLLLMALLVSFLAALFLGFWWYSLIAEGIRFDSEFRALKLGRVAGIGLMVLVIVGQLVDVEILRNLAWLAVVGFLFQGLAVMHARSHSDRWPGAVIVLVYLVLINPWTMGFALLGLSAVGLLDNVFELRAKAKPRD